MPFHWKKILKNNFTSFSKLARFLDLSEEQRSLCLVRSPFVLNVPNRLAEKMEKKRLDDPIFRQFIPLVEEEKVVSHFSYDPLSEVEAKVRKKLLSKYSGRVLLVTTSACAMHCRYCFRRHFPYEKEKGWENELKWIKRNSAIREVILSGGDPLSLDEESLGMLLKSISQLSHIKMVRFHSRFPIGIPERIDDLFLSQVRQVSQQVYFVIHANHPKELDEEVIRRLSLLKKEGVVLLNQTVLLRGVNDSLETLQSLFEKLIESGILPYYLFQLDQVQGASHFEVEKKRGLELMEGLRGALPGYAVPKYVYEQAGAVSKVHVCE